MFYRTPYIRRKGLRGRGTSYYLPFAADMVWKHTKSFKGGMNLARRYSDGREFLIKDLKKSGRYLPLANSFRKQFKLRWDRLSALQKSTEINKIIPRIENRRMKMFLMRYARNFLQKELRSPFRHLSKNKKKMKSPYSHQPYRSSFSKNPFSKWANILKREAIAKVAVTLDTRMKTRKRLNKESFDLSTAEEIAWENTDEYGGGLKKALNPYTKEKVEYRYYVSDKGKFNGVVSSGRKMFFNHLDSLEDLDKIKFLEDILRDVKDSKEKKILKDHIISLKSTLSDEGEK